MAKVNLYKQDGKSTESLELPDALFAVKVKPDVIHEVLIAQLANGRTRYAQTKDRSEVRGGGRKPWKQKGTGRARHGSNRSPIWSGGGVTFGPLAVRRYVKKVNKKVRRKALAMVLTDKLSSDHFIAVDDLSIKEAKTSTLIALRKALPGSDAKALIVTTKEQSNLVSAAKNLPRTATIGVGSLNVRDLLKYPYVIVSAEAVAIMKETYLD
jgi:large subunit ribosomal protein L4